MECFTEMQNSIGSEVSEILMKKNWAKLRYFHAAITTKKS